MNEERIDELRQRLRALGYLDAGVDRFVLAPARGTRGPIGLAMRASVRVGLLGGLLLGPAAALGLGARVPGLVSGPRDAVVLAIYLAILFFAAVAVITFVVSLLAAQATRASDDRFVAQARRISGAAGWLTTLACLAYLTLWWRNANAGFGWSAPIWTAFALIVAVAISLLLGHAVRIATMGVIAARGRSAALPPVPSTSWRVVIAGGVLAFAGSAALLLTTSSDAHRVAVQASLAVVNSHAPIRLVALDGFDPATYAKLEASLPNLHYALGRRQVTLAPQDTSDPARAWTTIATGMLPDAHGVHAIETTRVAGLRGAVSREGRFGQLIAAASDLVRLTRPSIVSREQRQSKTIWEVAEDAGLRTAVVNWWATWPAPSRGGIVVTDRAVLRLEHGGALDAEIAPASIYQSLSAQWPAIRAQARHAAVTAFPDRGDPLTGMILRRSAELDARIAAIAQSLSSQPLDLFVIYLPGLDIAQNALLGPSAGALSTSAMAARVDALRSYYPFLDSVLSPLVEPLEGRTLMIVTQPGRVQTTTGGMFAVAPFHRERGIGDVAPLNSHAKAGADGAIYSPVDVAPTVWWALGLPLSRELAGKPELNLFGLPESGNDRYVATYGRPFVEPAPRTGKPLDQEMIDRLRSLGYVK
jgi:hypothetical protein